MNPIDEQLKRAMDILRANGGVVGMNPASPDWIKRAFLESLMDCPECREMIQKGMPVRH